MLRLFIQACLEIATICLTIAIPLSEPAGRMVLDSGNMSISASVVILEHRTIEPRFGGHVAVKGGQILDIDTGLLAITRMI